MGQWRMTAEGRKVRCGDGCHGIALGKALEKRWSLGRDEGRKREKKGKNELALVSNFCIWRPRRDGRGCGGS